MRTPHTPGDIPDDLDHAGQRVATQSGATLRAKLSEDRLALPDEILPVLADAGIPDEAVGTLLRERIGMDRLRAAHAGATVRLPKDHGHLALLEGSYTYIRQFAPKVLEAVRFKGGTEAKPLIEALEILRELNATGARNVPDKAPTLFVPTRWQGYLRRCRRRGVDQRGGWCSPPGSLSPPLPLVRSGSTQELRGQRDVQKAARSAEPRVMNATRMMGSMQTACITAYHGGQTPGIRSTPMIAMGMMTARALTRSKVRRDPREAETVIR